MTTILNGRIEIESDSCGISLEDKDDGHIVFLDLVQCELLVKFLRDNKIVE